MKLELMYSYEMQLEIYKMWKYLSILIQVIIRILITYTDSNLFSFI